MLYPQTYTQHKKGMYARSTASTKNTFNRNIYIYAPTAHNKPITRSSQYQQQHITAQVLFLPFPLIIDTLRGAQQYRFQQSPHQER